MESISIRFFLTRTGLSFLLILFGSSLLSQSGAPGSIRVAFYNVENLFDPTNDSTKNDDEFTPEGMRNWSDYRYREKSNRMAKAILSIGEWEAPDVVGLAEVENRKVVVDLTQTEVLRKFNYEVVHYESPDRRGIDVAMIYRKDKLNLIYSKPIPVLMPEDPSFATRDVLYAKLVTTGKDTIHIMYCHWPSRYGGQAQSEPKRILAAQTVRGVTDSIFGFDKDAKIVIAGDFNDEWNNISLRNYLTNSTDSAFTLVNLMAQLPASQGSHRYRGVWSYLDQVIVSKSLMDGKDLDLYNLKAEICNHEFLLEKDEKYPGQKPFRSFIGMKYHGGFSDHLPIYIDLIQQD